MRGFRTLPPHCGCHPPLPATSYRLAWCTWEWAATRGRSGSAAGEFSSPIHSNVRHFRRFCSVLQPLSYIGIIAALSGSVSCRPPLARSATCLPLFVLCRLVLLLLISAGSVYCTCKLLLWFSLHGEAQLGRLRAGAVGPFHDASRSSACVPLRELLHNLIQ